MSKKRKLFGGLFRLAKAKKPAEAKKKVIHSAKKLKVARKTIKTKKKITKKTIKPKKKAKTKPKPTTTKSKKSAKQKKSTKPKKLTKSTKQIKPKKPMKIARGAKVKQTPTKPIQVAKPTIKPAPTKPIVPVPMFEFEPKIKATRWDPVIEPKIFEQWQKQKLFKFDRNVRKPVYSIDTPPPYVNTPVHIGQAYTYCWMDMIARFQRMIGCNVLFPMGLDKNGLPIEVQTEKQFGISMHQTPREEFIAKCKQVLKKSGDASLDSFKKLGLSCNDWSIAYEVGGRYDTDNPEYRKLTQETFITFWKKGLIYEDVKPTNYCPVCRTTISDAEVEYDEDAKTKLNYIKFYIKATGDFITIATTRPELLAACKLIIYNPEDERYKHLEGKTAVVPLYRIEVPILPHPYAKQDFGTGLVMICSFGDYSDVRILREMEINPTYLIDQSGKMNDRAGKYKGLTVEQAREQIIADLLGLGLLERQLEIVQRRPLCWRSKSTIEFVPMKEFYLKQLGSKDQILKMTDEMKFFAPESKQILLDWINSINIDWVISRRRFYGTEIPLWYCANPTCNFIFVPKPGKYYQPWKERAPIPSCPKCGSKEFRGEHRTFDTWFDSSTSEAYILGYLWSKEFFKRSFPCTLRPQGKEIVRTWLYFTMLKSLHLFNKKPFEHCWIHKHVVDEAGEKMSKSKGNMIDPQEVLKKFGADAFRIWTCLEGDITQGDIRCSFDRIQGTAKFLTKFWNIAKFISGFPQPEKRNIQLLPVDRWMLTEVSTLVKKVRELYAAYKFFDAVTITRDFIWNIFAAHYIELVKPRAYNSMDKNSQRSAWFTLHSSMQTFLKILSPIIPYITENIWQQLDYSKRSIHIQQWPEEKYTSELAKSTQDLVNFNSLVWNSKKELGLSLKDPVAVTIPKNLTTFEKDLTSMHHIDPKSEHKLKLKPEKVESEPEKIEKSEEKKVEKKIVEKKSAKSAKKKKK